MRTVSALLGAILLLTGSARAAVAQAGSKRVISLAAADRIAAAAEAEARKRGRPSGAFEQQIKDGRLASLVLPGATPLQGGVPITFEGKVIGAIGVSGNTPREDEEIALAGAAVAGTALAASP